MPVTNHRNFRLRGIPIVYEDKAGIRDLVKRTLDLHSMTIINVHSLAVSPSDHASRIATISFPHIPSCFLDQSENEWAFHLEDGEDLDLSSSIVFDTHFRGFTPFQHANPDDCHADIIAVTGLGGHVLGSFKQKHGPFVWLRDALPVDVPNMRILSYGYDTAIINSMSFQNLTDLAKSFHLDLEGIQDSSHSRRIVFIAHSLGGLLVKETVVQMTQLDTSERSFLDLISGFMFFGVPHQGLAVECLVPMIRDSPNRALLESLGKNSPLLSRLQREFSGAITTCRQVISFYETERSPTAQQLQGGSWEMSGPSEVLVEVSSANCGSVRQYPINRNHSEMVKFNSRQDDLYQRVVRAMKPLLMECQSRQTVRGTPFRPNPIISLSQDEKRCLQSLSFQEQEHRYAELNYDKNTCEWLLEDSQYQAWLNAPRGLFWIKGSPGTGKSVLMKFAVEDRQRGHSADLVVSFFIHGRGVSLQRTPLGVYRALLSSLFEYFPTYLKQLTQRFRHQEERFGAYERKDGWLWTESELQKFLANVLSQGTNTRPVTVYVDALDECGEDNAKELLRYFSKIMSMVDEEQGLLKICFSSRHYPILGFETMPTLLVEDLNGRDIRLVVRNRLKQLNLRERRYEIENYILKKAQGGFQWAILVTDIIQNEVLRGLNRASLHQAINTIPEDLQKVYDLILSDAKDEERSQMVKLFQWVLFSERPLSTHELRAALTSSQHMTCTRASQLRDHPNYSDTVSDFEIRVRHLSRGLLEFHSRDVWEVYQSDGEDWDREAQFIHQSAADFVLQNFLRVDAGPGLQSVERMGHFEISRSCLRYMVLQDILESSQLSRRELSVRFPLLPYAVTFLLRHIKFLDQNNMIQNDLLEHVQWHQPDRLEMFSNLWRKMDPDYSHAPMGWPFLGGTALHILVGLGSVSSLQAYLNHNTVSFDARDSYGNTPLLLSLREGREDLALLLIDQSVALHTTNGSLVEDAPQAGQLGEDADHLSHLDTTNSDGETPLGVAVSTKAHRAIRSLLRAGADPRPERGLLFYAIDNIDRPLVSDLIERQVCLDGAVFFAVQTQYLSSGSNHKAAVDEILSALLNAGANSRRAPGVVEDLNLEYPYDYDDENEDEDAIIVASHLNLASVVKLLIMHGGSPAVKDFNGDYPLQIAIENGNLEIVEVLSKASVESEDITQADLEELLFSAIKYKDIDVASIIFRDLYGDGVPSDILKHRPESALHIALDLEEDPFEMVKFLLIDGEIDFSILSKTGKSPLRQCLSRGRRDMVRLILDTGKVDIHKEDNGDESPFWWAMRKGENPVVEFLLGLDKCNIYRKDSAGRTALWWLTQGRPFERGRIAIAEAARHGKLFNHKSSPIA